MCDWNEVIIVCDTDTRNADIRTEILDGVLLVTSDGNAELRSAGLGLITAGFRSV